MEEENGMTKSAFRNTRWQLMEQRIEFIEQRTDERLRTIETKIDSLKVDEVGYRKEVRDAISQLRIDTNAAIGSTQVKIEELQKIIYKAIGAIGAILGILQIVLKVLR